MKEPRSGGFDLTIALRRMDFAWRSACEEVCCFKTPAQDGNEPVAVFVTLARRRRNCVSTSRV